MFRSSQSLTIRPVKPSDAPQWEALRNELWPAPDGEHRGEIAGFFAHTRIEPESVLVVESDDRHVVAFAELSIRNDLTGLEGKAVGYVEGMYVIPERRNSGIARRLLQASRDWAYDHACEFFGSDRADRIIMDPSFRKKSQDAKFQVAKSQDARSQDARSQSAKSEARSG
jgi:aminoglycoside 6'-N-acetyltransferase I